MKRIVMVGFGLLYVALLGAQVVLPVSQATGSAGVAHQAAATPELSGVTVYDPQQLRQFALAEAVKGGQVVNAEALAQHIARRYHEDGFLLAEVLAQRDVAHQRWVLRVNEGQISNIEISGVDVPVAQRIEDYFSAVRSQRPLRAEPLERALALAGDLSGVSLKSTFRPDPTSDASILSIEASQARRTGGAYLDFVPMRPGYAKRLSIVEQRYSLAQAGDMLRLNLLASHEPQQGKLLMGNLYYRAPWGRDGDYTEWMVGNARSEHTQTSTPITTETHGLNASVAWGRPLHRNLHDYVYAIGVLDHASAKTLLGVSTPRSEATAMRLYAVAGSAIPAGDFRQGWVVLSAGRRPATPTGYTDDGEQNFAHIRLGGGLSGPWQAGDSVLTYRLEAAAQWAPHSVPGVERFYAGHYPYLRGYVPGEVYGDRGAALTAELTHKGSIEDGLRTWTPFAFLSVGHVRTLAVTGAAASSWSLASAGLGLRAPLGESAFTEMWAGVPLRDGPVSRQGDWAGYLSLGLRW